MPSQPLHPFPVTHHFLQTSSCRPPPPPSQRPFQVVAKAAEVCPIIRAARDAAVSAEAANHGRIPPVQGEAAARLAVSIASRGEGGSVASHSGLRSVTARRVYSP